MAALRTPSLALFGIPPLFAFLRPGPAPGARPATPRSGAKVDPRRNDPPSPPAARPMRTPVAIDAPNVDIGKVLARAAVAPELAPIEWDGDRTPLAARADRDAALSPAERPSLAELGEATAPASKSRAPTTRAAGASATATSARAFPASPAAARTSSTPSA